MKKVILLLMMLFSVSVYAQADGKNHSRVKVKNGPFSRGNVTNVTVVQQQATVSRGSATQIVAPTVAAVAARPAPVRVRPTAPSCQKERPCRREDFVQWYPAAPVPERYPCPPPMQYVPQPRPVQYRQAYSPPVQYEQQCPPGTYPTPGYTTRYFHDGRPPQIIPGRTPGATMAPPTVPYRQY